MGFILKCVQKEFNRTYEEKKSKFIAYLVPYSMFKNIMDKLRKEHPKARHFVYAYRYINEFDQIVENCSDDGEPKGTSGKPSLAVLSGASIVNSAVIIIRYFGGIKLGTGGLVRAYGSSVNSVIDISTFNEYKKLNEYELKCSYSLLSKLEYILNQENVNILSKDFNNHIIINISISKDEWVSLRKKLPREVL